MTSVTGERGVLVGCDQNQEWLLAWWWEHYSRFNTYPVAFVDFGMSPQALSWCQERGELLSLAEPPPALSPPSPFRREQWERRAGDGIWPFRAAWFKKPLAFLRSPFPYSLWLDLDCEVRGDLTPLFHPLLLGADLALVPEPEGVQQNDQAHALTLPGEVTYNSGVVPFRQGAPILHRWAEVALSSNEEFMGDQNALSRVIYTDRPPLVELPPTYNWKRDQGDPPNALIVHYIASCKLEILKSLHPELF